MVRLRLRKKVAVTFLAREVHRMPFGFLPQPVHLSGLGSGTKTGGRGLESVYCMCPTVVMLRDDGCHVLFACCMLVRDSGYRCDYCMFSRSVDNVGVLWCGWCQRVLPTQKWAAFSSCPGCELAKQQLFSNSFIWHACHMISPPELHLVNDRLNVGHASSVKDFITDWWFGRYMEQGGWLVGVVVGHVAVAHDVFDKASTFLLRRVVLK